MSSATIYRLAPDVRFRVLDGEAVVLRLRQAEMMVLNEVGARILELMADGSSLPEAASAILEAFEVEPDELSEHLTAFVAELEASGLIEPVAAATGESGP